MFSHVLFNVLLFPVHLYGLCNTILRVMKWQQSEMSLEMNFQYRHCFVNI